MDYSKVLNALTDWALGREDVRAIVLTGSAAAGAAHPLSDRDIQVFTTNVEALLADESWWSNLGDTLVVERLSDVDGNPTRLAYYAGGKLDFTLIPADQLQGRAYDRPFKVLLDKDGAAATTSAAKGQPVAHPSPEEFEESINWAWAAALMEAKAIVRDEPWSAKLRDQDLKGELLRMIEWDHRARYGTAYDIRHLGTRMRQWMDADIQERLKACWAGFDDVRESETLLATASLYIDRATRTAAALGFPEFNHSRLEAEMVKILQKR